MTQSYAETTFNVPLTGEQIAAINFFRSYWKINNPSYFDITSSNYDQDYVDEWERVENILKNTSKIYERNLK
tara:strand:- start:92 stop:307 length:216 start_codon:yes stop_codon:yes gene_type:complete